MHAAHRSGREAMGTARTPTSEHLRNWLIATAAVATVAVSLWTGYSTAALTREQAERTRQTAVAERFSRSVEQLASPSIDVRLGSIFAMEQLARDDRSYRRLVIEILVPYVFAHTDVHTSKPNLAGLHDGTPDMAGALTVLGRLGLDGPTPDSARQIDGGAGIRLRLRGLDLDRLDMRDLSLRSATLAGANLSRSWLSGVDLQEADLRDVLASNVTMSSADLRRSRANGLSAPEAKLAFVDASGADLNNAALLQADLTFAKLRGTDLSWSVLNGASLENADLTDADLRHASLFDTNLAGANLRGADLRQAHLDGANLTDVVCDARTRWPAPGRPASTDCHE